VITILFTALQALALIRCEDALMSTVYEGETKIESTRLCVEDQQREGARARVQAIASTNCRDTENEKPCLAYAKAQEVHRYRGLKAFDLCLKLGGEPQSLKFQMTSLGVGVWHVTDRCRFDLDYSYLDTKSFAGRGPFKPQSISSSSTDDPNRKQ
jgi:hypothetical protein